MDTLVGTSRNIKLLVTQDEKGKQIVRPEIEAVFTLLSKQHEFIGTEPVAISKLNTFRFALTLNTAKILMESLEEWIESAEEAMALVEDKEDQSK